MSRSRKPAQARKCLGLNNLMEEFDGILGNAAAKVQLEWFELPVTGEGAVYRERVYCYELYHQMRCCWPNRSGWRLNGEVDKRNHPDFGGRAPKPDFLVHVPGTHHNYAVIEVKSGKWARTREIERDIKKLIRFSKEIKYPYELAIYLIFGAKAERVAERVKKRLQEHGQPAAKVEVWVHSCVGKPAVPVSLTEEGPGLSG